jgi:putative ABC transport system permease protein
VSRLFRDFRYAARQLRRTPGFTVIAVVTLALGIGASTAVFAFVNALVFRPIGSAKIDDVYIPFSAGRPPMRTNPGASQPAEVRPRPLTTTDFRAFLASPPAAVAAVTALGTSDVTIRMPGRAQRVRAEGIAGDYRAVFGLTVQAGRFVDAGDDAGALANVVVSDRLWRRWFGGDRSGVGRATITVNNQPLTIVGVTPAGYGGHGGTAWSGIDVWMPLSVWRAMSLERQRASLEQAIARQPALEGQRNLQSQRNLESLRNLDAQRDVMSGQIYLRARPGTATPAVAAAFEALYSPTFPDGNPNRGGVRVIAIRDLMAGDSRIAMGRVIVGLGALVLIAACANLANLLYARGAKRAGEVAVRLSLGGRPVDIFRLFVAETTILSGVATAIGLTLAAAALQLTGAGSTSLAGPRSSRSRPDLMNSEITPDVETLLFALAAGSLVALGVGFLTAWRASRVPPLQTLAAAGVPGGVTPRSRRWRVALVAVQVTAAVLLMIGTGLYVRRAAESLTQTVRFDTAGITAARIDLSLHAYTETRGRAFYQEVLNRVRALPGVESATLTDGLPGYAYVSERRPNFLIISEPTALQTITTARRVTAAYAGVADGFFEALGVRLLRGRALQPADRYGAPLVAVVCESLAARLWPGEEPIGKRLMFGNEGHWRTVVGLSSDPIVSSKDTPYGCASCVAFVPWDQRYAPQMLIMARSARPAALVEPMTAAVRAVDAEVAIQEAAPLDDSLLAWVRPERAEAALMGSLGVLALVIASLGVYGVVSFLVSSRTREFGIRLALGATPRRVVGMVLDHALHLMLVGLLPGVLIASLGSRILENRIRDLMPNDIPTWIVVPLLVLVVGLVAGYIPARRASRIDPTVALREL